MQQHKSLYRSRHNRMFAGVAAGLGEYLGFDPVIVRLVMLALILIDPRFLALYILMAIIVPQDEQPAKREQPIDWM
jgi:phage shock protein C